MVLREITIGDLPDFIESEEYLKLDPKPITPLRAISQFRNPDGRPSDAALVYASDENRLLAFAGLLPDKAAGDANSIYSNSGWWVHPEFGRKYGLPVFLKAVSSCRNRMFFTDCSEHTKSILERTGLFHFPQPREGKRFFLYLYSSEWLYRRGRGSLVVKVFSAGDAFVNLFLSVRYSFWRSRNILKNYSVRSSDKLDQEMAFFVEQHADGMALKQDAQKLNWIIQNPWITAGKGDIPVNYPFSHIVKDFRQEFLVIRKNEKPVALLYISVRDNHASVPYIFYEKDHLEDVVNLLWHYLIRNKINSMVMFNAEVLEAISFLRMPFIFKSKIIRYYGYSKELNSIFAPGKKVQDGEGDVAFT